MRELLHFCDNRIEKNAKWISSEKKKKRKSLISQKESIKCEVITQS